MYISAVKSLRLAPVLLALAVVALGCSDTGTATLGTDGTIPPPENMPAAVFLRADSTPDEIAEVRRLLEAVDPDAIEFVDQDETHVEFLEYFKDDPNLPATTSAADMPPSFRVWPFDAVDDPTRAKLNNTPQVRYVTELPTLAELRLNQKRQSDPRRRLTIVYLKPDSGEQGKAEVEAILSATVSDIYFVDQAQTLEEFSFFFEGDPDNVPDVRETIDVDDMPPSWRVDLNGEHLAEEVRAELLSNPYVRNVSESWYVERTD